MHLSSSLLSFLLPRLPSFQKLRSKERDERAAEGIGEEVENPCSYPALATQRLVLSFPHAVLICKKEGAQEGKGQVIEDLPHSASITFSLCVSEGCFLRS